jgi:acyl carrier protein
MKKYGLIILLFVAAGCGSDPMLPEIQKIAAEQLQKTPAEMNPDATFAALGADDLDIVEITMAVEDKMGISISDDALVKAAGTSQDENLAEHLTPRAFAKVATAGPKQPASRKAPQPTVDDGTLREAQVGTFRELSHKANPNGYVLVFLPSLDVLVAHDEQQQGRKLSEEELADLKEKSVVIALSPAMAEHMKRKQAERTAKKIDK